MEEVSPKLDSGSLVEPRLEGAEGLCEARRKHAHGARQGC